MIMATVVLAAVFTLWAEGRRKCGVPYEHAGSGRCCGALATFSWPCHFSQLCIVPYVHSSMHSENITHQPHHKSLCFDGATQDHPTTSKNNQLV